jgi:hypothetical protein
MPQTDPYANHSRGLTSPAISHFPITPADGVDLPTRPRVLKALTSGNVAVRDQAGVVIVYPVFAGDVLQFAPVGVEATGTTATVAGWL